MILHLVQDEKIINRLIQDYEQILPGQNHFICFIYKKRPIIHVSPSPTLEFYCSKDKYNGDLSIYDKVVFHFLTYEKIKFCKKYIKHKVKYYWYLWGGDMYNGLLNERGYKLYSPENSIYKCKNETLKTKIKQILKTIIYKFCGNPNDKIIKFISNNINVFVSGCDDEFNLLKNYLHLTDRIIHKGCFYYPIDQILGPYLADKYAAGNNILCGNSCSFTNNHEYVMNTLSKVQLNNHNLIFPINYGGNQQYKDCIIKKGNSLFGKKFHALVDFLPIDEYNKLMLTAEIYVYGSWRQEAFGNIVIALYLGAKVYLSNHSPLLNWFRNIGIIIFELESIDNNTFLISLTQSEKENNRQIMANRYSFDNMCKLVKELFVDTE